MRVRYCGEPSADSEFSYCVVRDMEHWGVLSYTMYGVNSYLARTCGFIAGPTWADDMIRRGLYPPKMKESEGL